jgi:cell division protein FtsB
MIDVNDAAETVIDDPALSSGAGDESTPAPRPRPRRRLVGPEARQLRQKRIRYALLFVSAVFMINALVGDNGLLATLKARRQVETVQRQVNALREENQHLKSDMNRLKSDPSAIEEQARRDLGLIRPGETLVIVKDAQTVK